MYNLTQLFGFVKERSTISLKKQQKSPGKTQGISSFTYDFSQKDPHLFLLFFSQPLNEAFVDFFANHIQLRRKGTGFLRHNDQLAAPVIGIGTAPDHVLLFQIIQDSGNGGIGHHEEFLNIHLPDGCTLVQHQILEYRELAEDQAVFCQILLAVPFKLNAGDPDHDRDLVLLHSVTPNVEYLYIYHIFE